MQEMVIITDQRTGEMRSAGAWLAEQGYGVKTVPDSVRLWREAELRAFAEGLKGTPVAGVIHPAPPLFLSPLETTTEEEFARARDEGPIAAWCVAKVLGGLLKEQGGGSLIFVNSIHAEKPLGQGFLFSAGCGAVQMLSREINQDYGTAGVRSYFIQRGPSAGDPDGRNDFSPLYYGLDCRYPERKLPAEGSLNALLGFLLTPAAAPLAGSDLRADGGMTMYYGQRVTGEQMQRLRRQKQEGVTILGDI